MKNQKLLQRLVECLAANEGIQPTRAEIRRRLESLTPREVDVLCCVLGGQLNREIAPQLRITERTVKAHRGRTMKKLAVRSTAELLPMVSRYIAYPAWPKFRRRRKSPEATARFAPGQILPGLKNESRPLVANRECGLAYWASFKGLTATPSGVEQLVTDRTLWERYVRIVLD